jgi:pimeloyl-ACP methyl ester carboxylesterase
MKNARLASVEADLRYEELAGDGLPLVFVHGMGCASSVDYADVARERSLADRPRLLLDLLGSGKSDRPINFSYTIADHARTVVGFLDALELEQVNLFGHSMGGSIAIVAAGLTPGRIRSLVASEPNLDPGGGQFSRMIAGYSDADFVAFGQDEIATRARQDGDYVWASTLEASAPFAVHRSAVSLVAGSDPSWREILRSLPMPRAIIFGEKSLPDPDVEALPRMGVETLIVPNAGHGMATENPAGLATAIAAALTSG